MFICVIEFHYKSPQTEPSFIWFINSIIKLDTVMFVGVVHLDPAAESAINTSVGAVLYFHFTFDFNTSVSSNWQM